MNGLWDGYWGRGWFGTAAAWGLGAWAIGSIFYDSGYCVYSNPYGGGGGGGYNYSQPIETLPQQTAAADQTTATEGSAAPEPPAPPPEVKAGLTHLELAQEAFKKGDYDKAGAETDLAIKQMPTDAATHEFRALVHFAKAEYPKAASVLYAVLSAGPGWNWTTLSGLYPDFDTYTKQLRALEQFVKLQPDSPDGHFVLAYHYITATHKEAAVNQLQEVLRLLPGDQLATQLVKGLGGDVSRQQSAAPPAAEIGPEEPETSELPDIDSSKLAGKHTARRADGTMFTLKLTADKKFTWSYERGKKKNQFSGTYSVDGAVLVLERPDKATMPGLVEMKEKGFNFKLFGAPDGDPGLDFN